MADKILIGGQIWTVDPNRPWAEAAAVRGSRFLAVGTTAEIGKLAGRQTETVDLRKRLVLPGFIDSHVHFLDGGFALMNIQLRDVDSRAEFIRRIAAKAKASAKGEWILNGDWDHQRFNPVELPRRDWIDAVTPDNPVCVNRLDGHMILANGLALGLAGITKSTPTPPGGEIVRDPATGEPTGILKDAAMDLVYTRIPERSREERIRAVTGALKLAAEKGVTSVHDVSGEAGYDVYRDLLAGHKLTARLSIYFPISDIERVKRLKIESPEGGEFLKIAGLKGFADGSLGSSTAYFFEPYADSPETCGLLHAQMFPRGIMNERVAAADRSGLQVAIHAIGDRANSIILDLYEETAAPGAPRDRRFRIEHAQHLRPQDIPRFARLNVIASVQPYHLIDDGRWAEKKIGRERARFAYPLRSFSEAGVTLACGSDWPVASMDPIMGIYAAVTRRTLDGRNPGGWIPEQKIPLERAIQAFTLSGACAEFAEGEKGSIVPGKLADLIVLDKDLFSLDPASIPEAKVVLTMVGGEIVFRR
jgi:predicted amidohydrolase YtcJ